MESAQTQKIPSVKTPIFTDRNPKSTIPSVKTPIFTDGTKKELTKSDVTPKSWTV
jgi:hypothetical protein